MTRLKIKSKVTVELEESPLHQQCQVIFSKRDWIDRDLRKEDDVSFTRTQHTHGNFRWRRGLLAGIDKIVKQLFYYPKDVTEEEIFFMEDVVNVIEDIIDSVLISREGGYEKWRKELDERKERMIQERIKEERKRIEAEEKVLKGKHYAEFLENMRSINGQASGGNEPDHLYLMRHVNGLTKIGRSVKPEARERTLQAEDPRLELIYVGKYLGWLEKRFHDMFAEERVRGEWFDLKEHRVDWIKYYCELKTRKETDERTRDTGSAVDVAG